MDRSFQATTALIDISENTQVSSAVAMPGRAHGAFRFPAAMTGATVTFLGRCGQTETTYKPIHDSAGDAVSVTVAVDTIHPIPDAVAECYDFQFVSGSEEAADRTIFVFLKA